ncbi:MAG: conjugal transfer protein TraF [Leptothrix ochracea]|uniref:conjugal transfer protein TraF n=1 Tax=Leptothrix ochracea TaxID=735331 RepID=UPI0034E1CC58
MNSITVLRPLHARRPLALALAPVLLLWAQAASANQSLASPGYSMTVGPGFNRSNLGSSVFNPANAERLIDQDSHVRFGLLDFGFQAEMGQIDNLKQETDALKAKIDAAQAANSAASAQTTVNEINARFLPLLERGLHVNVQGYTSLLSPIIVRSKDWLPGVWTFNMSAQMQGGGALRTSDAAVLVKFASTDPSVNHLQLNVPTNQLVAQLTNLQSANTPAAQSSALQAIQGMLSPADQATAQTLITKFNSATPPTATTSYAVTTASGLDIKGAVVQQVSLGYAAKISQVIPAGYKDRIPTELASQLDVGMRLSNYNAQLYRQLAAVVDANGNATTFNGNGNDPALRSQANAIGLDVGVAWHHENYQLGATLYNLNNPSLRYPDLRSDPNPANNLAAQTLAAMGKVKLDDSVSLKPHVVVEGAVRSSNQRWLLQGSMALNETTDFVGEAHQVVTLGASYNAERYDVPYVGALLSHIVPSLRVGYRQDLVGTKLTSYGLGMSWGIFNFDAHVSSATNSTDTGSVPRSAGVAISIAQKF